MQIQVRHDTSPKKLVGNKPFYFTNNADRESFSSCKRTGHMTYNQACTLADNLKKLGIDVLDSINVLGV